MNNIRRVAKSIINVCKKEDVSLFVGAGISLENPANLPSAMELKWNILKCLAGHEPNQDDVPLLEEYLSSIMLELFIQNNVEALGEGALTILRIFNFGEPNTNHLLIAKLAKLGLINRVFTTNFDSLIERALDIEKVEYHTIATQHDFADYFIYPEKYPHFTVLKLHGTLVFTEFGNVVSNQKEVEAISPLKFEIRKTEKYLKLKGVPFYKYGFERTVSSEKTLIATLESMGLKLFESVSTVLEKSLKNSTFIIIGWNGFDVDISPLFLNNARKVIWIAHKTESNRTNSSNHHRYYNLKKVRKKLRRMGWNDYLIEMALLANTEYPMDVLPTPSSERVAIVTKTNGNLYYVYTPDLIRRLWKLLPKRIGSPPSLPDTINIVNIQKRNHFLDWDRTFHPLLSKWGLAKFFLYHGEYENNCLLLSEDLIKPFHSQGLHDVEALIYIDLGELNAISGNIEEANKCFLRAIEIYNEKIGSGSKKNLSGLVTPFQVGEILERAYFYMGELACEFYRFKEAEEAFKKMNCDKSIIKALIHYCREEFRESHELLCETVFFERGVTKFHYYLQLYLMLIDADMLWLFKNFKTAARKYEQVLTVSTKIGWPRHQIHALNGLAKTYSASTDGYFIGFKRIDPLGRVDEFFDLIKAAKYSLQAIKIGTKTEHRVGRAFAGYYFGRIYAIAGLNDEANSALKFSEGYFKKMQHSAGLEFCRFIRSRYNIAY